LARVATDVRARTRATSHGADATRPLARANTRNHDGVRRIFAYRLRAVVSRNAARVARRCTQRRWPRRVARARREARRRPNAHISTSFRRGPHR
jgi:hypothetical protein